MTTRGVLTARHRRVIEGLVQGKAKQDIAGEIGIRPATISRFLRNPYFVVALHQAQDQALEGISAKMRAGAGAMLDVLEALATDEEESSHVRVRAALGWLAQLWRALELQDMAERMSAIEERLATMGLGGR